MGSWLSGNVSFLDFESPGRFYDAISILLLSCVFMCVLTREVVSPKGPDLVLSADIPDVEARVLVGDGLDVESDGRDGVDFAGGAGRELEGVEDGFGTIVSYLVLSSASLGSHWCGVAC